MKKLFLTLCLLFLLFTLPSFASADGWTPVMLEGRDSWHISASSTLNANEVYQRNMLDGNPNTYWHSYYEASGTQITYHDLPPIDIDITLPEATPICGISYTTRQDNKTGICTAYKIYGKAKEASLWNLLCEGTMDDGMGIKPVIFSANVMIQCLRFEITESVSGYGTCAEFNLIAPRDDAETLMPEDYAAYDVQNGLCEIDKSMISASCENPCWGDHTTEKILDGTSSLFWQTDGTKDPVLLTIDLGSVYTVAAFDYAPRQTSDFHGTWTYFTVWSSEDGENYEPVGNALGFDLSNDTKRIYFPTPIKTRYLQFEISGHYGDRAGCGELTFYQPNSVEHEVEEYQLTIGKKEITVTHGDETKTVTLDVAPYIDGGYTLIPLRGLLEEMAATVDWDGDTQTVTVKTAAQEIVFQIWYKLVFVTGGRYGTVRYTLNQPPRITDGRTFIPLRFVSEHLGYTVDWDAATQTITIKK